MTFDLAFRHQQALDPSALTTIASTLHAITKAVDDCRNAGIDPEKDAAVILLARHFATVCSDRPDRPMLQTTCMHQIHELAKKPALVSLARRGVGYDAPAKDCFHAEGKKAMRQLAVALALEAGTYQIRSNKGGMAVSGEIILHADQFYIQLSLGVCGRGQEVLFRRCRGRKDYCGERNHFAGVGELVDPERLAARIRRELQLEPAMVESLATLAA